MYLHLSRNLSIHAGDVVAIVNLTGRQGRSVCQHCGLPLVAVDGIPEKAWRCLVVTGKQVFALPVTGETVVGAIRSACTRQGMYSKMFDFTV